MKRVLVFTGGDADDGAPYLADRNGFDLVIAADSGLDRAEKMGIRPDLVIGDLDSASPEALTRAGRTGVGIDPHPAEKDHTDLELAFQRARAEEASEILVVGGGGGRPDHWLANLSIIAGAANPDCSVGARFGGWRVDVVRPDLPFTAHHVGGDLLSLVAMGGDAEGVTTRGLAYPLSDERLHWRSARGISNVAIGGPVRVDIRSGTLLVLQPTEPEGTDYE